MPNLLDALAVDDSDVDATATRRWKRQGGKLIMPAKQSEFLTWLLSTPRFPPTLKAWCQENKVSEYTAREWKRDRRFLQEWERRAQEYNISVDRTQGVLDTLHSAAIKGDVNAAREYLKYVDKLTPPRTVERDSTVADLSDEDLAQEILSLLGEDTPDV